MINLNMDFSRQAVINTNELDWSPSRLAGVTRKPLAREAAESGHATSIVRYEPGSKFDEHTHPQGEEIFVLEGIFSDESGDFGPGTYIRNPPGSSHSPYSEPGCVIFVKLQQFEPDDSASVRIDTHSTNWFQGAGNLQVMPLHQFNGEHTALVKWPAGERFLPHRHMGGEEILVLSGKFLDEHGQYPALTWLRSPHLSEHFPYVEEETTILVKTGHLPLMSAGGDVG
jgi:anti-sigma factor ChrR (cupin superfamily)